MADSEDKVGYCPFEPDEKRAPRHAPSFELFRLLARLTSIKIGERNLTPDELSAAVKDFGNQQSMTFRRLRILLGLPANEQFLGVASDEESKREVGRPLPEAQSYVKC